MTSHATLTRGVWGYAWGALAGILSGLILAFALAHAGSILVLLAYFAAIPLFLTGLSLGTAPAILAALFATVGIFATSPASYGVFYVIADAIPVTGLLMLALRRNVLSDGTVGWSQEGSLLTALASYPCLIFLGVYTASLGHDGGLLAMTQEAFAGMSDQFRSMLSANGQPSTPELTAKIQQYFDLCARIAPALAMFAWIFSTLLAMAAAQGIVQSRGLNLRPAFSLNKLHVPNWVVFAAALTGLTASFAPAPYDYVGLNLALVLGIPFFFTGLAIIHMWAAQTRFPILAIISFYVLISVIVHLVLVVALLGVVDQWVDFRKRAAQITKQ